MESGTSGNPKTTGTDDCGKPTSKENENKAEPDADDVPGDFFDDFLKDDFMAGLDIVDEDDDDDENPFPLVETHKEEAKSGEEPAISKKDPIESKSKSTNGVIPTPSEKKPSPSENSEKHPLVTRPLNRNQEISKKIRKKNVNTNNIQVPLQPGNPNKKVNIIANRRLDNRPLEKNAKANVPQLDRRDPLKTQRDIVRDKIKCEKDKEMKIISEKLMVVETGLVPPGLEMEVDVKAVDKNRPDPINRLKRFSPPRRLSKHRYSAERRRRSISPRRHNSGSYRGRSPRRSPRRRRSPLEPRYKRSRYSPGRRRSRSYSPQPRKREEKKSFLEELAEKLQEMKPTTTHMMHHPYQSMPPMHQTDMSYMPISSHNMTAPVQMPFYPKQPYVAPVPAPVPAPLPQYRPELQQPDMYDRNYFIGDPQNSFSVPASQQQMPYLPDQNLKPIVTAPYVPATERKSEINSGDAAQLFHDKKISLSEFLSTTAKQEVNSQQTPVDLRERVKVISRCQDAIKYLDFAEKKFSGCLVVYKGQATTTKKFKSPLSENTCAIPYTDPHSMSTEQLSFSAYVDRMLQALSLKDEAADVSVTQQNVPPPPKISKTNIVIPPSKDCDACKERKRKIFKSSATQCDFAPSFSVSTQVSDEDFRPKMKPQSLASMTPAQLLSAEMGQTSKFKDDFDSNSKLGMGLRKPYPGLGRGRPYNPFLD